MKSRSAIKQYKSTVAKVERAFGGVATGQTIARMTVPPIVSLLKRKILNVNEATAAAEIIAAYRMSIGAENFRDPSLGVSGDVRFDSAEFSASRRIDAVTKYRQWRVDLNRTPALAAAISILIDERGERGTERANQWRHGTARAHLIAALRHFAVLRGNAPRGCKDWRYRK